MNNKKYLFIIISVLFLNSFSNASYIKYEIDSKYNEYNNYNFQYYQGVNDIIKDNLKSINYDEEKFYLKININVSYNGALRYSIKEQSQEGYNNKVLVNNKLKELSNYNFKKEMENVGDNFENLKYKGFNYIFFISN